MLPRVVHTTLALVHIAEPRRTYNKRRVSETMKTLVGSLCTILLCSISSLAFSTNQVYKTDTIAMAIKQLGLQSVTVVCNMSPLELKRLQENTNVTIAVFSRLQRDFLSGSVVICSQDVGWTETVRMLSLNPTVGTTGTWTVLHNQSNVSGADLTMSQRVFFLDMATSELQETYRIGAHRFTGNLCSLKMRQEVLIWTLQLY